MEVNDETGGGSDSLRDLSRDASVKKINRIGLRI